jgi:peptidoglycan/LPS O-acetylase OafA/YrhL
LRLVLYWLYPANQQVQYVFLPCRMEGLAIGAWIAIRFRQGPWPVNKQRLSLMVVFWAILSIGSAAWAGCLYTAPFNRTIGFLLSPIFCGYAIFWIIQFSGTPATAWLRTTPLRYLGKISYAAYLIHWPVANALTLLTAKLHLPSLDTGAFRLTLIYVFTFGVSALSWHYFEKPTMQLNRKAPSALLR